ncbi:hypothetical protein ILUMI_07359 [Ignelater luminosus]|uniref:PPM-type phosphatase domain-containing protein n=1 Tax=Ignelater luminosus TaxID=2038154 RepID=A0A8K0GGY1_IGNLU|nr:hypothetical protein ILUMI_07359 [Ignelater luminosus]
MPSLRKRVSSYFRQLSFYNEPREKKHNINENSFVTKYLEGHITLKEGPPILYGKNPTDLPNYDLGIYEVGPDSIIGCYSGPNGGLTTIKRLEKHLSIPDTDIDFIDTQEEPEAALQKSPNSIRQTVDNTTMVIKVAGQEYLVTNRKKQENKSHSLGSLSDFEIEIEKTRICTESHPNNNNNNNNTDTPSMTTDVRQIASDPSLPEDWNRKSDQVFGISDSLYDKNQVTKNKNGDPIADCFGIIARNDSAILAVADGVNWGEKASIAAKSAVHGCLHYLDKTIFNDTKPFDDLTLKNDSSQKSSNTIFSQNRVSNTREIFVCLLRAFNCAHDLILENEGMLTTLTVAIILPLKAKNDNVDSYVCCVCNVGDTLAYVYSQKYGVRELTKGSHDINCNRDMRDALGALGPVDGINPELSNLTLSVTVVQKGDIILVASDGLTDNFDPNVCKFTVNSKDTKFKRPTAAAKESCHNKENVDTNVTMEKPQPSVDIKSEVKKTPDDGDAEKNKIPVKPPRKNKDSASRSSRERSVDSLQTSQGESSTSSSQFTQKDKIVSATSEQVSNPNSTSHDECDSSNPHSVAKLNDSQTKTSNDLGRPSSSHDVIDKESSSSKVDKNRPNRGTLDKQTSNKTSSKQSTDSLEPVRKKSAASNEYDNPLVAQFMRENSLDDKSNLEKSRKGIEQKNIHKPTSSQQKIPPKTLPNQPKVHVHKTASRNIPLNKTLDQKTDLKRPSSSTTSTRPNVTGFLRSKTSLDMRTSSKTILRNEDGIPFVTPLQRYEISLLLIEDVLKHGISGHDTQCTTAKKLCENLVNFTFSISSAKRHTLEDVDLYFDNIDGVLVEVSQQEKKIRRRKGLERVQNLPGKLDHVTVVAYNVGNFSYTY